MITLLLSFFLSTNATAQLTPPGLGKTNTAFWSAVGVSQVLDAKNISKTYVGLGYVSGTESNNPFNAPSIFVLNQEFYHKLSKKWQYSYAISYRRQHEYEEGFDSSEPSGIKQEFRLYGRVAYTKTVGAARWITTLRQEARKFYSDDFSQVPEGFQLRMRLRTQLFIPLDNDAESRLMGSAELLFAIANDSKEGWGKPDYKESRFCLYYSYTPNDLNVTFDLGYMNDLIGYGHEMTDASYLAMDIVIKDPFSHS